MVPKGGALYPDEWDQISKWMARFPSSSVLIIIMAKNDDLDPAADAYKVQSLFRFEGTHALMI